MIPRHIIRIPSKSPPVIEFDMHAMAWYIRFSRRKVARTLSDDRPGPMVQIDLDEKGEVVGVELLGVKEFSIRALVKLIGVEARAIDLSKTRFIPAGTDLQTA